MATVNMTPGVTTLHPTRSGNTSLPYLVEVHLDIAAAAAAKGSALAAADVIELINVPAGSLILAAGIQVLVETTDTQTDVTVDLGVTGVDADAFVDGYDLDAATTGAYASQPAAYQPIVVGATADTIDLLFATATAGPSAGELRVWAVLMDVSDRQAPGIVALGS
jgi:hypothetical protein